MDNSIPQLQKNIWVFCMFFHLYLLPLRSFLARWYAVLTAGNSFRWWPLYSEDLCFSGMFYSIRNDFPQYTIIGFIVAVYACSWKQFWGGWHFIVMRWACKVWRIKQLIERIGFPALIYHTFQGSFSSQPFDDWYQLIRAEKWAW